MNNDDRFADRSADEYLWKKIPAGAKAVPSEGFGRYAHEIWVTFVVMHGRTTGS